jgi:Cu/Ag efflux pump CusA
MRAPSAPRRQGAVSRDGKGEAVAGMILMLKPRQQWGSGRNKAELAEAIQQDLGQLPGLRYSFSQPRNNGASRWSCASGSAVCV